jgi:hypothetical protein
MLVDRVIVAKSRPTVSQWCLSTSSFWRITSGFPPPCTPRCAGKLCGDDGW